MRRSSILGAILAAGMSLAVAPATAETRMLVPAEMTPVRTAPARRISYRAAQTPLRLRKKARWHRPRKSNMVRLSRLVRRRHRRARRGR
jgi:hypothetical protein